MWGDKKPDAASKGPLALQPQVNGHTIQNGSTAANANAPSAKAPALTGEARTMAP